MSRTLRPLTLTGAALAAAGLLALGPTIAYAQSDGIYTIALSPQPTTTSSDFPYTSSWASVSMTDGALTALPQDLPDEMIPQLWTGAQIIDGQGYATYFDIIGGGETGSGAVLYTWDHTTGALGDRIPLRLPADITADGGLLADHDEVYLVLASELDALPDGTLLTVIFVQSEADTTSRFFMFVASIDPVTGETTPLAAIDPGAVDGDAGPFSLGGLATDPITGTTWVFINTLDENVYAAPAVLDAANVALVPLGDFEPTTGEITVDLAAGDFTASATETADYDLLEGPIELYGESGGFLRGADFDATGVLWSVYGSNDIEAFALTTIGAPFAPSAAASFVGELPDAEAADTGGPVYLGAVDFLGINLILAVDSAATTDTEPAEETLPETGIGAGLLAPIGALAVAVAGGTLLLAGARRRQNA